MAKSGSQDRACLDVRAGGVRTLHPRFLHEGKKQMTSKMESSWFFLFIMGCPSLLSKTQSSFFFFFFASFIIVDGVPDIVTFTLWAAA